MSFTNEFNHKRDAVAQSKYLRKHYGITTKVITHRDYYEVRIVKARRGER